MSRNPGKGATRIPGWLCAGGAIALMMGFLLWWMSPDYRCTALQANDSGALLIDVNPLARASARLYCWSTPDRAETVRFIVGRRSDGAIEAVLDACRTCYRSNLGYRIENGVLICRFCANRYSLDKLADGMASCRALALPFTVDHGIVMITTADLMRSARYFPRLSIANRLLTSPFRLLERLAHADRWQRADAPKPADRMGIASKPSISTLLDN